jgi:cadmium resistance protein CadD (predicted permease)
MGWLLPTILTGCFAFVSTNMDDLLLLTLLYSSVNFRKPHIIVGQYLGSIAIILLSTVGFFGKLVFPLEWIGFLGVVPILMGISRLIKLFSKQKPISEVYKQDKYMQTTTLPSLSRTVFGSLLSSQTYAVAILTIANGLDNISTYVPLFANGSLLRMGVLIGLFLLLAGIWCYLGYVLAHLPAVARIIERYVRILLPFIFIMLGILILVETGTVPLLFHFIGFR